MLYEIGRNDTELAIKKWDESKINIKIGKSYPIEIASWNNNLELVKLLIESECKAGLVNLNLVLKHPEIAHFLVKMDYPYSYEDVLHVIQHGYNNILFDMKIPKQEGIINAMELACAYYNYKALKILIDKEETITEFVAKWIEKFNVII
jgi:hypothetical protein